MNDDKLKEIAKDAAVKAVFATYYDDEDAYVIAEQEVEPIITRACEEAQNLGWHECNAEDLRWKERMEQQLAEAELNRRAYEDEITRLKEQLDVLTRENDNRDQDELDFANSSAKEIAAQIEARKQAQAEIADLRRQLEEAKVKPKDYFPFVPKNWP